MICAIGTTVREIGNSRAKHEGAPLDLLQGAAGRVDVELRLVHPGLALLHRVPRLLERRALALQLALGLGELPLRRLASLRLLLTGAAIALLSLPYPCGLSFRLRRGRRGRRGRRA